MLRRTKIIATLGPATDDPQMLENIIKAGVDVVRLNFSLQTAEIHQQRAKAVRQCAEAQGRQVGIIADLQGTKVRIEGFNNDKICLREGERFILDASHSSEAGNQERVGLTYKNLSQDVRHGDTLLLDDGRIVLMVTEIIGNQVICEVAIGGVLSSYKGINRRGGGLAAGALSEKDRADIVAAAAMQVDYLAISFLRSADDIYEATDLLRAAGSQAGIIAKIERTEALANYEEIIKASDAIIVARGDLGVEIGEAALPPVQKMLINKARDLNKVVIVATQMMESMIDNPFPTHAEVSDVANAVFDGTDAVTLSAETAIGKHPDKVIATMDRVCREAEKQYTTRTSDHRIHSHFNRVDEAIAMSAMYTANHLNVTAIATLTESGATPLWMSRISSGIPIFSLSQQIATCRKVTLYRGVYPINLVGLGVGTMQVNQQIIDELLSRNFVKENDLIILTKGDLRGIPGGTNVMKIIQVGEKQMSI